MALTQYPWLEEAAARLDAMRERLPNAILIHGMPGVGTFELARWFAERLLCESPKADGSPCGKCPGCRMMHANGHPDCRIVVSEFLANALDLPYTPPETSSSSKKLSREIRIHQFRALTDFLTMASSRGGRRCVLVYPADMVRAEAGIFADLQSQGLAEQLAAYRSADATDSAYVSGMAVVRPKKVFCSRS